MKLELQQKQLDDITKRLDSVTIAIDNIKFGKTGSLR
jgi:hypothetical protein